MDIKADYSTLICYRFLVATFYYAQHLGHLKYKPPYGWLETLFYVCGCKLLYLCCQQIFINHMESSVGGCYE